METKFRVNDKVFIKLHKQEYFGIVANITKGDLNVDKHNRIMFSGVMKVDGKKWTFSHYTESNLKLMCNEKRHCKTCKHRLRCITEGV